MPNSAPSTSPATPSMVTGTTRSRPAPDGPSDLVIYGRLLRPSIGATLSINASYCPRPSTPSLTPLAAFVAARAAAAIGASPGSRGWMTTGSDDLELLGALHI